MSALAELMHPGHNITVTSGPVRVHLECSCGIDRRFASATPANRAALQHHHDVGGCNCPPQVLELEVHPAVARRHASTTTKATTR